MTLLTKNSPPSSSKNNMCHQCHICMVYCIEVVSISVQRYSLNELICYNCAYKIIKKFNEHTQRKETIRELDLK